MTKTQTVARFAEQWLGYRASRGVRSVVSEEIRLRLHIIPVLVDVRGISLPMEDIDTYDLEMLVARLDRQVREGKLAWATAERIWAVTTKMFDDATRAKDRTLRCLSKNPAEGVKGPDRGRTRSKNFLYPNEFLKLIHSPHISQEAKFTYVLATYTGLRAGELAALRGCHIDLDHSILHVEESLDAAGDAGPTKGGRTRTVPIEGVLWDLLATGKIDPNSQRIGAAPHAAKTLREDLARAGVRREGLFRDDSRVRHITFHDLRATYITWCAIRGDDPLKIQRRAGHSSLETTQLYIREAENCKGNFGEVFPQLPRIL